MALAPSLSPPACLPFPGSPVTGFGLLTIDTTPNYNDTQAFPATLAKWIYRAIFRVGDAQVGAWSSPVSVTVPA